MTITEHRVAPASRLPIAVPVAIGLAWATSLAIHTVGHHHAVDHHALLGHGGTPSIGAVSVFALAWTVMITAMMLPSTIPLLRLFTATASSQPRPRLVMAAFVGSYVALWTVFGVLALGFDGAIHRAVDAWSWLQHRDELVAAGVLGLAGAFQFSELKDRCLSACRHPAAFLVSHYRRGAPAAFSLGLRHGLLCIGCCWALMLVAFATGMTDLRWMAAFTALMTYEKVGRHGEAVARVAGVVLLAAAVVLAIGAGWPPTGQHHDHLAGV